uniref:Uncharacterized protein n=1 Tax=Chromera velia CCMP2878 TaxID=1169474 RepID=A0A0G4FXL4_9ALVE|eukprot:Cvel_19269.t1-p1 / transcript=Cvel_19269.t1 / gene=Cvel_19269 / organism=Chromera_velia_CCMP2878 / gene_product=hypothetical protein / transcript_product=hypothetical protein / location=Cvel_scaffold1650:670-1116(+) / protein_length=149 / sequence_SO=supercontig / SO=protein_coding / is_pseudo=false
MKPRTLRLLFSLSPSLVLAVGGTHLKCRTDKDHDNVFIINEADLDYWKWWSYEGNIYGRSESVLLPSAFSDEETEQVKHAQMECVPFGNKEFAKLRVGYPKCGTPRVPPEEAKANGCLEIHDLKTFEKKWPECSLYWSVTENCHFESFM